MRWQWVAILVAVIVVIAVAIKRRDTGGKPDNAPYAGDIRRTSWDNSG